MYVNFNIQNAKKIIFNKHNLHECNKDYVILGVRLQVKSNLHKLKYFDYLFKK